MHVIASRSKYTMRKLNGLLKLRGLFLKGPSKYEGIDIATGPFCISGQTLHDTSPCLFVLRFYGPVNQMGSCRARLVHQVTHLLGRFSPLSG